MKPHLTLAETLTSGGSRMTLHSHDGNFSIRIDGKELMHSAASASELLLGELAVARISRLKAPRILVGGLGLGFTLKRVLETAGSSAVVHVAELMPAVIEWNRTFMSGLNGALLQDSRVTVFVEDVSRTLDRARHQPYDAILLDIDNGPAAMVQADNARLYEPGGIRRIASALSREGRVAVWSATPDRAFAARLTAQGFSVQAVPAKLHATAKRFTYTLYVADKTV